MYIYLNRRHLSCVNLPADLYTIGGLESLSNSRIRQIVQKDYIGRFNLEKGCIEWTQGEDFGILIGG